MDSNISSYNPKKWNKSNYIKYTHNCYEYALNDLSYKDAIKCKKKVNNSNNIDEISKKCSKSKNFSIPGYYKGFNYDGKLTCSKLKKGILLDNPYPILYQSSKNKKCKPNYYKIASAVDKNNKYLHFYRQHENNIWSHKPGILPVTNLDESQNIIKDLDKADLNVSNNMQYKICNYFCVSNNNYMSTNNSAKIYKKK